MIQTRLEIDDYTARVLDVVKGKFGLKNRSEALQKLVLETGDTFVEPKTNELVLKELDLLYQSHKNKYGNKKMSDAELKKLLEL